MICPIENIKDINYSKDLCKIIVRARDLWFVTSMSNKKRLELVIVDAKVCVLSSLTITIGCCFKEKTSSVSHLYIILFGFLVRHDPSHCTITCGSEA